MTTAERVIEDRRIRMLLDFGSVARSAEEASSLTLRVLASNPADVPFARLFLLRKDGEGLYCAGETSDTMPKDWPIARVVRTQRAELVVAPVRAFMAPLGMPDRARTSGVLVLGVAADAVFDEAYRSFGELVARQVEALLTRAHVHELERAARASEAFVDVLAHDLRNPLGAILTGAYTLARMPLDERVARAASRMISSGERIAKIVDQLVDLARIHRGAAVDIDPCNVDVLALVRRIVEQVRSAHEDLTIELEASGEDRFGEWDAERIGQVFWTLLGNAAHYRTQGSSIRIVVDATAAEKVCVTVHNQGAIADEALSGLFDPCRRSTAQKQTATQGLGLGLCVSRGIVRAHGGEIEVTSTVEKGTSFCVTIPLRI